jgi:hypothetical protein
MTALCTPPWEQTCALDRESVVSPPVPQLTVVCAWCRKTMRVIPVSCHDPCAGQESHSLCETYKQEFFPDLP